MAKRKRRRRRIKRIKGKGLFENIQNWVVKTAIGISPIPGLQRELKPKIRKKGWKKDKPVQFIPREVWRAAGVPKKTLDKFVYAKKSDFK